MNPARSPVAFGRYIITRRIARGGMAEIYRARTRSAQSQPARWVAIKMMRSTLGHEELRERLFEREVRIATRLNHPNVVPVYEFGQELGRPYLAMEYMRGRDLAHLLKPQGEARPPIPFELGLYIGVLAARGLGHAHRLREESGDRLDIVHRDVSPGNVMVGYDGTVKVLDFGVARVNETQGFQTQTGTLRGKFAYMSPEQTLGEELDARSDVFSFGTVLYELLTGTNCFRAGDPIETLERVQGMRPVPPSRAVAEIPKEVDRILAQCLSKDRRRRFPDGLAVSEAIADYLRSRNYEGHRPLVDHMAKTFSWEQHEEASELAREQEEVALMEVVDFVPDLTNDGLDSKHISVREQEEASSSEVRQMSVSGDAGESVFQEEPEAPPSVLDEDQPLGRGEAVEAASLLHPAPAEQERALASPAGTPELTDAPSPLTAHTVHSGPPATDVTDPPEPPLVAPPGPARAYRGPATIAAVAAGAILLISWVLAGLSNGPRADDPKPTPTPLAPVTIRVDPDAKRKSKKPERPPPPGRKPKKITRPITPLPPPGSRKTKVRPKRRRSAKKRVKTGYLNVGAKPWAEITIDGKRWPYQTPQAGIELPVGKHVVVLYNPKTGVRKRTAVYIKSGKYKTVNLDLRRP